ncbi:siderophore-interacting protein [Microvirga makkahensis]|uniref:SIP domain-containing protein n=1 Tax=Microvirga makkahensis TaxID=1128670 RepID=A0A7X3MU03_9HYPH|nr:siderophore-interacting protein [Microvirga makkahensis]MXQ13080.1 SIP domain-containing protein [Microvirga makkahensis]
MTDHDKPGLHEQPRQRPPLRSWTFRVVDSFDVPPGMRRVVMTADDIREFAYKPGQAILMMIPLPDGGTGRRDYTIRSLDRTLGTISVDFVLHGETPAPTWARRVMPGDTIEVKGPRGGTVFQADADWHLLTGDETCIPAIAHILETMPAGSRTFVFIETGGRSGEIALQTQADATIRWVHRNGAPAGPSEIMNGVVQDFPLPPGKGHAYLIGETSNVRRQRHTLIARGLTRNQISSEGYWRPGRIGGHDHIDD